MRNNIACVPGPASYHDTVTYIFQPEPIQSYDGIWRYMSGYQGVRIPDASSSLYQQQLTWNRWSTLKRFTFDDSGRTRISPPGPTPSRRPTWSACGLSGSRLGLTKARWKCCIKLETTGLLRTGLILDALGPVKTHLKAKTSNVPSLVKVF